MKIDRHPPLPHIHKPNPVFTFKILMLECKYSKRCCYCLVKQDRYNDFILRQGEAKQLITTTRRDIKEKLERDKKYIS
jgi:hypothetical protein